MSYIDEVLSVSIGDKDRMYRHAVPNLELSVERHTGPIPDDGRFYVIHHGQVLKGYQSVNEAEEHFRQIVKENRYHLKSMTLKTQHVDDVNVDEYFRRAWKFP